MESLEIFSRVHVYKNLLKDAESFYKYIDSKDDNTPNIYNMFPWKKWTPSWHGFVFELPGKDYENDLLEELDEDAAIQNKFCIDVHKAYVHAYTDYMSKHADDGLWPDFIKNWDFNSGFWTESQIQVLRYDEKEDGILGERSDLAMNYHTDTNHVDLDSRGNKIAITVTMYLNDDYEGGEISIYDDNTKTVYDYKPKAGDVTVFPGFQPYYHGVLPFKGSKRYLIRIFYLYRSPGTEEWLEDEKKYGTEKMAEITKTKLKDSWDNATNVREIIYPGGSSKTKLQPIFVDKLPIRIE